MIVSSATVIPPPHILNSPGVQAPSPPGRVLLIDDEEPMRRLVSAALEKRGIHVASAMDGDAAVGQALSEPFDLVLLDLVMPHPDGMEMLRKFRQHFTSVELPIIMLTGVDNSQAVIAALESGANDYLTKPFDLAVLLARVKTQVTLRRQSLALRDAEKRMRQDLEAAALVQQNALPPKDLRFGKFEFAWLYEPCEQLSGDGLNIFPVSPKHIGFFVADASGHGVRAALLSSAVNRLLLPAHGESALVSEPLSLLNRNLGDLLTPSLTPVKPSSVMSRMARRFRDYPAGEQLFTLLYALLNIETGDVQYAAAGHPPPIHISAAGNVRRLPSGGMMIGAHGAEEPVYSDLCVRLEPGDRLILHTDGVTEARSPDEVLFGADRLLQTLAETPPDLDQTLQTVSRACRDWSGSKPADDDRTVLAVRRSG